MDNREILSSQIKAEPQSDFNAAISESTVKRRTHEAGRFGRIARKKLYVNKTNGTKRLEYARIYREVSRLFGIELFV